MGRRTSFWVVWLLACNDTATTTDGGTDASVLPDASDAAIADGPPADSPAIDACPYCTDAHNCGSQGHDCLGGQCVAGKCQPITLYSGDGTNSPSMLALNDSSVFWAMNPVQPPPIKTCAKSGCNNTPTTVAASPGYVNGVATNATQLFFTDTSTVWTCSIASCSPSAFVQSQAHPTSIVLDSANAYWTNAANPGSVVQCSIAGCGTQDFLTSSEMPVAIAVDSTTVFWVSWSAGQSNIHSAPIGSDGGAPTLLASTSGTSVQHLAVDATNVYWSSISDGVVLKCAKTGCGQAPTQLAASQSMPYDVAADGTDVYWGNVGAGTIVKCAATGCNGQPTVLASSQDAPNEIAVDANAIYWTSTAKGGGIMKLAK